MFSILSGLHPFKSKYGYRVDDHLNGRIVFRSDDPSNFLLPLLPNDIFNKVSVEAKELILRMTCADPKSRITVEDALNHQWFLKFGAVTNIPRRIENNTQINVDVEDESNNNVIE